MYDRDNAIKIIDKLDIDMSGVQDPKDVQDDRCAIALLEHNAPQTLAFNDEVQGICCIDSASNKLECLTLLTCPANYRLSNKIVYASESTCLSDTYRVQFQIQELEGRVVTPMPKGIADRFQIPYIEISNIKKWSDSEYETPKEFDKYFPSTKDTKGAKEADQGVQPGMGGRRPHYEGTWHGFACAFCFALVPVLTWFVVQNARGCRIGVAPGTAYVVTRHEAGS